MCADYTQWKRMSDCYVKWDGDDWQQHINSLLGLRFTPGTYQPIPDRAGGDYGLEGFSSDGIAFQCYAAEEPLSVEALTDKQRDKITRDIKKLCDNHNRLAGILGQVRLHTWVLMVPRYDSKQILVHAEKKAEEVRAKRLPIVTDNFRVAVQDDAMFGAQKAALMNGALSKLALAVPQAPLSQVGIWTAANTSLVQTLDQKLQKLNKPPEKLALLKAQMVKHFLEGQNAMQYLHANYPLVEENVLQCKDAKERGLVTESLVSSALPEQRLKETLEDYRTRLATEIAGVTKTTADILAHEAAADWLLRCPLDFAG
jgi:hypothetical protein